MAGFEKVKSGATLLLSIISGNAPEDYHRCHLLFLPECLHPVERSPSCLPSAATRYAVLDQYDHSTSVCTQTVSRCVTLTSFMLNTHIYITLAGDRIFYAAEPYYVSCVRFP